MQFSFGLEIGETKGTAAGGSSAKNHTRKITIEYYYTTYQKPKSSALWNSHKTLIFDFRFGYPLIGF